jgi:hypothetical protein
MKFINKNYTLAICIMVVGCKAPASAAKTVVPEAYTTTDTTTASGEISLLIRTYKI